MSDLNTSSSVSTKRSLAYNYIWLVVLTLLEVVVVRMDPPKLMAAILMGATTFTKTMIIGLDFMHIKYDRPIAWLLPLIPIFLAIIFVIALFPDLVYHLPLRFQ